MNEDLVKRSKVIINKAKGEVKIQGVQSSRWIGTVRKSLRVSMCQQGRIRQDGSGIEFQHEISEVNYSQIYDDMSGKKLDGSQVQLARTEEMEEVKKHKVYVKVPIQQCYDETGKAPIGTRWVDINKGDDVNIEYRSRLVAQELKKYSVAEDLFAATPPLEAKKILFSMAVTEGIGYTYGQKCNGMKIDFIDVRRAYFHADARRKVYVKLPPEDDEPGMCGMLLKSMYGTRDAAQNWEFEYTSFMEGAGFKRGTCTPCIFNHETNNLKAAIHGDDFTILGTSEDLNWFRTNSKSI